MAQQFLAAIASGIGQRWRRLGHHITAYSDWEQILPVDIGNRIDEPARTGGAGNAGRMQQDDASDQ